MNANEIISEARLAWRRFLCRKLGHVNYGVHYPGIPQSHCRRCGKKSHFAAEYVKDDLDILAPEYAGWRT